MIEMNLFDEKLRRPVLASERGFTLIEVTVALVIFTLAVLIAARMQGNAVRSLKRTGETSMAMNLAVSTLENLRVEKAFDEIDGTGPNIYYDRFGYGFDKFVDVNEEDD